MPNSLFQSTLPARGATKWKYVYTYSEKISIHAPRTGSDGKEYREPASHNISIHAPRTGSDVDGAGGAAENPFISIHAPRTGSDGLRNVAGTVPHHFNPRSPHGERHQWVKCGVQPMRISIHAPRTGSDGSRKAFKSNREDFNPRSPHGERRAHPAGRADR